METLNSNVIRKMKILSYNINKCTQSKEKKSYPQILFDALKNYEQYIRKFPTLICGDFNCYVGQSGVSESTGTFEHPPIITSSRRTCPSSLTSLSQISRPLHLK